MRLDPGTRLGPYEILDPLGAGGMGEVYRARDVRLGREVAIKSLPDAFARDAERLARFEREAQLLASLSHPNIASLFGLEETDGVPYLVLELVTGETLAQRLSRGPLPLREALEVSGQVAAAVDAAHAGGVIHRDLKPGNVMLTRAGLVKVLDFGLAKSTEREVPSSTELSTSPTRAMAVTAAGILLGTAAYMSPEQARGKPVDARTDVWSFGCVLYECLAGRPVFEGETVSDLIARILEREPEWSVLPSSVPDRLRDLIRRCLAKNADERAEAMAPVRAELAAIAADAASPNRPTSSSASTSVLPSLAVLYFENSPKDPDSEYFCAGITEDILTDLSKIKGLRVASRNAVSRYRGVAIDLAKVGVELGVGAVLEGSVRRAGDRVRISAQLVNVADGFQLWAERYDRTLEDVFAVQEEIAASIAEALRVALKPGEVAKLAADRPNDVRAYDLYLKGRELYGKYSPPTFLEALERFREAIAIDPEYALAWAGVADCYGQLRAWGGAPERPEELVRLGLEAAHRAIALNPRLAEGYKAEALILRQAGDPEGARAALRKALQVNPKYVPALLNLGVDAFDRCDVAGAERLIRRALDVDPQNAFGHGWLSWVLTYTDRAEEGIAIARRLQELTNESIFIGWACGGRAFIHLRRGDVEEAEQALREGLAAGGEPFNLRAVQSLAAALAGRTEEARRLVAEVGGSDRLGSGSIYALAAVHVLLGQADEAVRVVDRPLIRAQTACTVRLESRLHPLLDHPSLAPRRWDGALVWPLEAPMIDAARHALFREVRIESGRPQGSDLEMR